MKRKRRARENLPPLLDAAGNITTKGWGKVGGTQHLLYFCLYESDNYPQGIQPPELLGRGEKQSKCPTIQKSSNLLFCLDCHKTVGPDGIQLRTEEADRSACQATFHFYQQSWSTSPRWLEIPSVTLTSKKGWRDSLGNYRPISLTLILRKVMEQIITWHHVACIRQPGDQA